MTEKPMEPGEAFKLKIFNMKDNDMTKPQIGDSEVKFSKSVLVCCRCQTQVEISGFFDSGLPKYKCVKNTCPAFKKPRNRKQRLWLEYETAFEYRKVGVIR